MDISILNGKKHIHFIGIGGSGMYPLAQILHSKGYYITGSDNNETETLQAVRKMGIKVFMGQRAENIEGADLIVHTAAIMPDNPELIAAKKSGVPVLERSQMLGIITQMYDNAICVSGTHGKTTTTSAITQILYDAGISLSAYIGGKLDCISGSGIAGNSDIFACESCEFKDHYLNLSPDIAVILNIDADHLDYFKNLDNIKKSFRKFAEKASKVIIANGDDANTNEALAGINKKIITFGNDEKNDYYAKNIKAVNGLETHYDAYCGGKKLGEVVVNVPGVHNVLNTLAAIAACMYVGVSFEDCVKGIADFHGAKRRFEKFGTVNDITVCDDYAHHPAELEATLTAAKNMNFKRVWAVFQPFTYSRTAMLLDDFAKALSIADKVVLTDIMGSREKNTYNIFTRNLAEKIDGAIYFNQDETNPETTDERKYKNFEDVKNYLLENVKPGDLVITLGCGDAYKISRAFLKDLEEREKNK